MGKSTGARAPWNGTPRGRPAKVAKVIERRPSCVWPAPGGACGAPRADGLALCREHAIVLHGSAGRECAWPPCTQFAAFRAVCPYHEKVAAGLLATTR